MVRRRGTDKGHKENKEVKNSPTKCRKVLINDRHAWWSAWVPIIQPPKRKNAMVCLVHTANSSLLLSSIKPTTDAPPQHSLKSRCDCDGATVGKSLGRSSPTVYCQSGVDGMLEESEFRTGRGRIDLTEEKWLLCGGRVNRDETPRRGLPSSSISPPSSLLYRRSPRLPCGKLHNYSTV